MKKTWKVLLCMALIMTMLLGSVAMAADVPSAADQAAADNHHAIAGLEGLNNGRDLGGYYTADGQYQIKPGLLLRTAKLADCTEGDVALLQSLGIKKVIDLRMLTERLSKPDKTIPGADNIVISTQTIPNIFAITGEDWLMMLSAIKSGVMDTYMTGMYRQLISDPMAIRGTQKFFKEVKAKYPSAADMPQDFRQNFRQKSLPLMWMTNTLTHNTRAIAMFISCLVNEPWIYPLFEITVLAALYYYMHYRHETMCKLMTV